VLAVSRSQAQATRGLTNLFWWTFDFDKPPGVRNVIKTNRATIQSIFLPHFGIGFFDPKIKELKNALSRLIFHWCLDLHPGLLASVLTRTLNREPGNFPAVTTETKFETLPAQTVITVEKFIALEATGMNLGAKLQKSAADSVDTGNAVLLFAFDAGA
jgi:hypothetical protein